MRFVVFFIVWTVLLGCAHWYVGRRVIKAAQLQNARKHLAWAAIAVLYLIPLITFFLSIFGIQSGWLDDLSWPGYILLGLFSLILTFFLLRDIVVLAASGFDRLKHFLTTGNGREKHVDDGRRRFLIHSTNIGIAAASAAMSGYGIIEARRRASIEQIEVPLSNLPTEFDGFRIAQFSDLHAGPTIKRPHVESVVEQIIPLKADMIAFTGDLVDGSVAWLRDEVASIRELKAPHGKFFVTGNHEYYSGAEDWIREASRLEFDVLMNEHRVITKGEARIVLAGVPDFGAGDFFRAHRSDPAAAIANTPEGLTKILLAHQPRSIFAATTAGYDLQLSGHTHGGQYFPGNYLARLNQPYINGLHKHGQMWIYVNRGIGYWGPPMRIGAPPELTVITLRKA